MGRHPLDAIFLPKSVAVVGATEKPNSVGRTVLWNLMNTPFGGPVYPVNPTRSSVSQALCPAGKARPHRRHHSRRDHSRPDE